MLNFLFVLWFIMSFCLKCGEIWLIWLGNGWEFESFCKWILVVWLMWSWLVFGFLINVLIFLWELLMIIVVGWFEGNFIYLLILMFNFMISLLYGVVRMYCFIFSLVSLSLILVVLIWVLRMCSFLVVIGVFSRWIDVFKVLILESRILFWVIWFL